MVKVYTLMKILTFNTKDNTKTESNKVRIIEVHDKIRLWNLIDERWLLL
jgi:hypothetical protein